MSSRSSSASDGRKERGMTKVPVLLLAGLAMGATSLAGQQPEGRWQVIPSVGVIRFDRTSALSSTDEGLSTTMWLSGGLSALYSVRPDLRAISQRVVFLGYGVVAAWDVPALRSFGPYLKVGAGGHSVLLDVQRTNSTGQAGGAEFVVGGGWNRRLRGNLAIQLELLDYMWSNWDRDKLNTVAPSEQNTVFEEDNPIAVNWEKPSLIHNLRLAFGFKFTPAIQ